MNISINGYKAEIQANGYRSVSVYIEDCDMENVLDNFKLKEVLDNSDVIVLGKNSEDFRGVGAQLREDQSLIDLARVSNLSASEHSYEGICW